MRPRQRTSFTLFALIQLVVCLSVVFSARWWCASVRLYGTDLCWLLNASSVELERAFPSYYRFVFIGSWCFQYLVPVASIMVALLLLTGRRLKENLLLVMFSTFLTLILAEVILRMVGGYRPGQFNYNQWVHPVDSLWVYDGFVTDSDGITKIDTALINRIMAAPEDHGPTGRPFPNDWPYWYEIGGVFADMGIIGEVRPVANRFWKRVKSMDTVTGAQRSISDSIFLHYAKHPFNDEGFYSPPFTVEQESLSRILILGDSFAWGHSTTNKTFSFTNELLGRGYNVFNTGISGADVSQYLAILKKYGPMLRPDVVTCNFYMGNDVQYFDRIPKQEVPLAFHTNAGVIYSNHDGVEFATAQAAYDNIMRNMVIPQTTLANCIMSKTVVSTYFWLFLANIGIVQHEFFEGKKFPSEPMTADQMAEMAAICDKLGAALILSVIPKLDKGKLVGAESIPGLFGDVPYHQPKMTVDMYNTKDGHFNDEGHLLYANYLEELIRAELEKKPLER